MTDMSPPRLDSAQIERLAMLLEELGEAQQIVGKILRHGFTSHHPDDPNGPDNRAMLERELGDVQCIIKLMARHDDVDEGVISLARLRKREKLPRYTHHQSWTDLDRSLANG